MCGRWIWADESSIYVCGVTVNKTKKKKALDDVWTINLSIFIVWQL